MLVTKIGVNAGFVRIFSTLYINQHYISAKLALKEIKMSRTTSLALRLDADLKKQASKIAEALGMDFIYLSNYYVFNGTVNLV